VRKEYVSYLPHITRSHDTVLDGDCFRNVCHGHCRIILDNGVSLGVGLEFTSLGSTFCVLIHDVFDEHVFLFRCLQVHTSINYICYVYKTSRA
jgi:hypothetical protein